MPGLIRTDLLTGTRDEAAQSTGPSTWGDILARRYSEALQYARLVVPVQSIPFYFRHPAFLASVSLALLYLTVLSFSGQMITFLLATGYNSTHVGVARTVSTVFELSATWISPRLIRRIGAVRAGIWSLSWLMMWLAAGVSWFFADWAENKTSVLSVSGLVGCVILSRLGLWSYDLAAQNIIQDVRTIPCPAIVFCYPFSFLTKGPTS